MLASLPSSAIKATTLLGMELANKIFQSIDPFLGDMEVLRYGCPTHSHALIVRSVAIRLSLGRDDMKAIALSLSTV